MRKIIFSIAAAASALVVAAPAAAAQYGAPVYGGQAYGAPYGNAYGYNGRVNPWARELQQIRYQADNLARQGRLTRSESRDLFRDINSAERAVHRKGRYGLTRNEARNLNQKIVRIQRELRRYSDYDGRRHYRRY